MLSSSSTVLQQIHVSPHHGTAGSQVKPKCTERQRNVMWLFTVGLHDDKSSVTDVFQYLQNATYP